MITQTKRRIRGAVREYLGRPKTPVEIHADPVVSGTYAIRTYKDGHEIHMLLVGYNNDVTEAWILDNLEECEFTSWPPTAGGPRFL